MSLLPRREGSDTYQAGVQQAAKGEAVEEAESEESEGTRVGQEHLEPREG